LLQRLPIHKIKIDKSFITHITTSSRDQALVEMTAFICQRLDLEWLAEGVETEEQRQALSKRGCQAFQVT
jgi:EAL domain-containing protein (putative c-di-GMP-specific phosphodiesterase class I)